MMDWPLHYWKCVTKQQLIGTQNCYQQDANVWSHATVSAHIQHPDNPYSMCKSGLKNENLFRKWLFKTMICLLEQWSVIMKQYFSTRTTIMRHPWSIRKCSPIWLTASKLWNTPGTLRVCSPETIPSTHGLCDGTDTYQYTRNDAEEGLEQHHPTPTNPRSSKNDLRYNPKSNCNDEYR